MKETAKTCDEIAAASGFEPPSWENMPIKLVLVLTEVNEARDGAYGFGEDPFGEELADIAIRTLSILHSVWGNDWCDRTKSSHPSEQVSPFASAEVLLWPIFRYVSSAVEHWRHDNKTDTKICLEYVLREVWKLAEATCVNLEQEIYLKCEKNKRRDHLHGTKEARS